MGAMHAVYVIYIVKFNGIISAPAARYDDRLASACTQPEQLDQVAHAAS